MHRRDFARSALIGAAMAAAAPAVGRAQTKGPDENVLFTETDPGHWGPGVAMKHVPLVTIEAGVVKIKTPHPQSEPHYIVSHSVVLGAGAFLSRKTFSYKDEPVSEHPLPTGYAGPVTVVSTCNLHDTWTKTVTA